MTGLDVIPGPDDGTRFGFDQARLFHARERTRTFRDVTKGLFRNKRVAIGESPIVSPFEDGDEERPVTAHTRIRISGATPGGVVFAVGDSGRALVCWLDGAGKIHAAAGDVGGTLPAVADGGVHVEQVVAGAAGNILDVAVACNPKTGVLSMWIDGHQNRSKSVDAELRNGVWVTDLTAIVFAEAMADVPAIIGAAGNPTNFAPILPLSFMRRQLPQHFLSKR